MRKSLFSSGHSTDEVYQSLLNDQKRDGRFVRILDFGGAALFVIAAVSGAKDGWPWFVGAVAIGFCAIRYFIDLSNRNFMLHMIDWQRAQQHEQDSHKL